MLKQIISFIKETYLLKRNPESYAKKVGVNVTGKLFLYGARRGMFGSEPFMIKTGNNVHITGECQFISHDGSTLIFRDREPSLEITKPIEIGDNVFIGYRTVILPGVKIGNNCVIGAGSIVNRDIPDNSVAVGVPCKVIKNSEELFEKLKLDSIGFGHLKGIEKEIMLKKYFNVK